MDGADRRSSLSRVAMVVPRAGRDTRRMHAHPDEKIHELAARQHGVVTRA